MRSQSVYKTVKRANIYTGMIRLISKDCEFARNWYLKKRKCVYKTDIKEIYQSGNGTGIEMEVRDFTGLIIL